MVALLLVVRRCLAVELLEHLELRDQWDVVRRDLLVWIADDLVLAEPVRIDGAENAGGGNVLLRIEDIVDHALKVVREVCVRQIVLSVRLFEDEWMCVGIANECAIFDHEFLEA